jgi:alkanesulfonate monooxygenase SsuD/methylene tetrahydromethanopterin reductase-like flavin-dependent oxidoreductase (luciferase family)
MRAHFCRAALIILPQHFDNRTCRSEIGGALVVVIHPARVAGRIATLDLVSVGRIEFGTGQGSSGSVTLAHAPRQTLQRRRLPLARSLVHQ